MQRHCGDAPYNVAFPLQCLIKRWVGAGDCSCWGPMGARPLKPLRMLRSVGRVGEFKDLEWLGARSGSNDPLLRTTFHTKKIVFEGYVCEHANGEMSSGCDGMWERPRSTGQDDRVPSRPFHTCSFMLRSAMHR